MCRKEAMQKCLRKSISVTRESECRILWHLLGLDISRARMTGAREGGMGDSLREGREGPDQAVQDQDKEA